MRTKIGQLFLIGVSGYTLTTQEKSFIVDNNIGGVVLFKRNVSTPEQVHALCAEIQGLRHQTAEKTPLFIAIDMEGGRVARLKEPFTVWPPLKHLGDADSVQMSFDFTKAMGTELRSVGINLDFAPCTDTFTNPKNTVIGDRAVSTDPDKVAKHAVPLIEGYSAAQVVSCAKHFPGHGNTVIDSHHDLPIENADLAHLQKTELKPFVTSFKAKVPMVMTAHILFPKIDDKWPVTLSEIFLKKIARDQMHFEGLIITDDLDMKAMASHYDRADIPVRAIEAGVDLILYCNEPESPPKALAAIENAVKSGRISKETIETVYARVLRIKKEFLTQPDPWPLEKALKVIGCHEHQQLSLTMRNGQELKDLKDPTVQA